MAGIIRNRGVVPMTERPRRLTEFPSDIAPAVAKEATGGRRLSATRPVPRRGLLRTEAAIYIGVGTTKFDELVATGRMPSPKRIDKRKIWDILALDQAFDLLPEEDSSSISSWDDR
jgi:hypothetical protein